MVNVSYPRRKDEMKEVRVVTFYEVVEARSIVESITELARSEGLRKLENNLASLLNDKGWHIEGVGGDSLANGFVVLVRER